MIARAQAAGELHSPDVGGGKKRKTKPAKGQAKKPARAPFNNPFVDALKQAKKEAKREAKRTPVKPRAVTPPPEPTDASLFESALGGAVPLPADPRGRPSRPPPRAASELALIDEDQEVVLELEDLVAGTSKFDISWSDEFVEGCVEGLDRRILAKLRKGEFALAAHLDLHGLTRGPAKEEVQRFVDASRKRGMRCVLIIHGRGLNSKDQVPILKSLLASWFERGSIARNVLAFCTALPHDGGAGAMYVLLRK